MGQLLSAYTPIDGYLIAREEKQEQRNNGIFVDGIQYGEVDMTAFASALAWVSPKSGERFIDLGSGIGKAVLAAAASYAFESCTGVEILEPLHDAALRALATCRKTLLAHEVEFICADALEHPWSTSADVVFVSLTCFTDEMVERVKVGAAALPTGARMLVTSRPLDVEALRLLRKEKIKYGRGTMTFLAYERV